MAFFDKKEEVLDLTLTHYGKSQLSKGVLRPAYYKFFDDGVLYDIRYAFASGSQSEKTLPIEPQNEIVDRIKTSPRLKTQAAYVGAETKLNEFFDLVSYQKTSSYRSIKTRDLYAKNLYTPISQMQSNQERAHALKYGLHTTTIGTQRAPRYTVHLTDGIFEDKEVTSYYTGSLDPLPIPQLSVKSEFVLSFRDNSDFEYVNNEYWASNFNDQDVLSNELQHLDGLVLEISGNGLILAIKEDNVDFSEENFELEIFEIFDSADPEAANFKPEELLQFQFGSDPTSHRKVVEDYFEVNCDEELAQEIDNPNFLFYNIPIREDSTGRGLLDTYVYDNQYEKCDTDTVGASTRSSSRQGSSAAVQTPPGRDPSMPYGGRR